MNLNQCNFIGRLGDNPESRYTQSGKKVVSFRIACSKKYSGKEHTEWISITAWEKLGEICKSYLQKGSLVFVSGEYQTSEWTDDKGNKRYSVTIVARDMKTLSPRGSDSSSNQDSFPEPPGHGGVGDDKDCPF